MRYMATYDLMETLRNTNQWLGATAEASGLIPGLCSICAQSRPLSWLAAWGEVTERTFHRMIVTKPDWGIRFVHL